MDTTHIHNVSFTHHDCLVFLEKVRWGNEPECPYCHSQKVKPKKPGNDGRQRRWWCNGCGRSFSVMINTIFHGSRLPLQKWFVAISILNTTKNVSSRQLGRDLDIPVKTAHALSNKIRKAMLGTPMPILKSIVEMEKTFEEKKSRCKGTSKPECETEEIPALRAIEH